ncbi:MAG TPA: DNA cytosine methyltransferase [Polyangiaceae bacterium]|jgi:DNA (cytosine-5)-methyltransferase 1
MADKPQVISLYTGAGGLDYGLEAAGFETSVAVEMDQDCVTTLRANRRFPVIDRDILTVPTEEILEAAGLKPDEAHLLIGGPPCQPFSKSGYWARGDALRLDDPRAATLGAYLRVLSEARPRAFILENVEGLAYEGKDEGLRLLLDAVEDINMRRKTRYRPVVMRLNAADYGVPQLRQRVFVVGERDGRKLTTPSVTHVSPDRDRLLFEDGLPSHRTAWDALADVRPDSAEDLALKGKWAEILPSIPEGQNYLWHTDRMGGLPLFGWRRRYWSFLLKLAKSLPSWTIQAQPGPATGPFHWENRRLSMRELCRLQTFPDDVTITGSLLAQQRQTGNAVPSLLAEVIGRQIRAELLELRPLRSALKLLPPDRSPAPPPERTRPVPQRFRKMSGEHAAHPGTGKGYRAASRALQA